MALKMIFSVLLAVRATNLTALEMICSQKYIVTDEDNNQDCTEILDTN